MLNKVFLKHLGKSLKMLQAINFHCNWFFILSVAGVNYDILQTHQLNYGIFSMWIYEFLNIFVSYVWRKEISPYDRELCHKVMLFLGNCCPSPVENSAMS